MPARQRSRYENAVEYYGVRLFAGLICLLPLKVALGLGSLLGKAGWILGIRRQLALANLRQALPEKSEPERARIAAAAAANFGRTTAEFIRYGIKDRAAMTQIVRIEGLEELRAALAESKGVILLTGHLGAWAVYFGALSNSGIPIALLVGKQHNERVDTFIHRIPGDKIEFISKGRAAVKKIIGMLQAGRAVVMVADQHAGKSGVMAPFLGRMTPTLSLPGAFAVKHGSPVFFMHGHRESDGSHRLRIAPLGEQLCASDDEKKYEITRRYNEVMGAAIRAFPDQYFWYHRRWRDSDDALIAATPAP